MLNGADVSSYQPSYSTAGLFYVFIKVTQGLGYVNPDWVEQRATARRAGLVTGFYHYPTISNSPEAEVDYFLSQINLVAGDILCLDWEWYGQNVSDQQARDYKDRWIARARQKAPGHRIVVYSDVSNWTTVDTDSNVGDGLWIATAGRQPGDPGVQHPWVFHQWTDSPLDRDVANFATLDDLKKWAGVQTSPTPAPKPTPSPAPAPKYTEDDMLAYLPPIPPNVDVDVPVEPAGTLTAPQGGAKNGPIWLALAAQGADGQMTISLRQNGKLAAGKPVKVTAGTKYVTGLPTDGSVDVVRVHSTVPLVGYVVGRQVA